MRNFERQGGVFSLYFEATPSAAPSDALVGVALGSAGHYRDLAAIVRFNPNGLLDARNGGVYAASSAVPYSAGVTRQIYMSIDLLRRKYSVSVDSQELARDFSFRTEQANALAFDGIALKVDTGGTLDVCNFELLNSLTCDTAEPGEGFVNLNLPASSAAFTVSFLGFPRAANMDGVMGVSAGPAGAFSDLAAAVRFGPSGTIDARNGSTYAALDPSPYAANTLYPFTLIADVTGHTYTVLGPPAGYATKNLAFRPQQANVASLANFAQISDSSAAPLTVCSVEGAGAQGAAWIHDAGRYGGRRYALAASNDRLLLTDEERTLVLDAAGGVASEVPKGAEMTVTDAQGNIYLLGRREFRLGGDPLPPGGSVYVLKYDADFNLIYAHTTGTTPDVRIPTPPSTDDAGSIAFVLRDPYTSAASAVKLHPDGETQWSTDYPVSSVALDSNGDAAIVTNAAGSSTISKLDAWGDPIWTRTFATDGASIRQALFDSLGNVAFWGSIDGSIDFGGTPFTAHSPEGAQGLFGSLGPDGTPRFVRTMHVFDVVQAIADDAGNIVVAGTLRNPTRWILNRFDADGSLGTELTAYDLLRGLMNGASGEIAVDSSNAVYWQVFPNTGNANLNYVMKLLPP
ncbi:MAG TPA: hypothetical protein VGK73_10505 [Polyangiaceae bacterium]